MSRRVPAVPPLSRPAWERVELRLLDRLGRGEHLLPAARPRPRRTWTYSLPAVVMLAVAALLWGQQQASVSSSSHAAAAVTSLPVAPSGQRRTSHLLTTSAPAEATLGEAIVRLATNSELSAVGSDDTGWHVNVERGQVEFEVAPRNGRPPFVVQAGETLVTVIGTRFDVVREGRRARVRVVHGRVQIDSGTHRGVLGAGEQWPERPSVAASEQRPEVAQSTNPAPRKARRARARRGASDARAAREAAARESFTRATRMESTDPSAAVAIYRQLSRGRGPWAANALYAEGRLELERGHEAAARKRLAQYLRSFPDGRNAPDVRSLLRRLGSE